MRFIVISLVCLLPLTIGCAGKQAKNPDQGRVPIEDKQSVTFADSAEDAVQAKVEVGGEQKSSTVDSSVDDAGKHFMAFMSLSATDPEAAYAELTKYVQIRFGEHLVADKWMELCYRLARDNKGTFRDFQHFAKWHIQMLTDVVPEKQTEPYTELLESLQSSLKYIEAMGRMLEKQGENLDTYEMPGTFVAPAK